MTTTSVEKNKDKNASLKNKIFKRKLLQKRLTVDISFMSLNKTSVLESPASNCFSNSASSFGSNEESKGSPLSSINAVSTE